MISGCADSPGGGKAGRHRIEDSLAHPDAESLDFVAIRAALDADSFSAPRHRLRNSVTSLSTEAAAPMSTKWRRVSPDEQNEGRVPLFPPRLRRPRRELEVALLEPHVFHEYAARRNGGRHSISGDS